MEENKSETITIRKDRLWMYSTFVLAALVVVMAFVAFGGNNNSGVTGNVVQNPTGQQGQVAQVTASVDDDALLGDEDAEVTIIEFSDYQCPFCRKFWTETFSQIKSEYIDAGKVNLVFRDFPLTSIHPAAQISGEAAECVREKGGDEAYFKFHDKIFAEQNILDGGSKEGPVTKTIQYGSAELKKWAKEIGYDIGSCLDSNKFADEVTKDTSDATSSGGQGTPYFVIIGKDGKGTPLSGAQPYANFKSVLDSKLA